MSATIARWIWTVASTVGLAGTLVAIGDALADFQAVRESAENYRRGKYVSGQLRTFIAIAYVFAAYAVAGASILLELGGAWGQIRLWALISSVIVLVLTVYALLRDRHLIRKQPDRRKGQ